MNYTDTLNDSYAETQDRQKRAVVCGAAGFIGHHLVAKLKKEGYWVRGVDIKEAQWGDGGVDEFLQLDLRINENAFKAVEGNIDEVYQLAADMGGMGFISENEVECLTNNVLINMNMIEASCKGKVKRYFYSSSVCIYPDTAGNEYVWTEEDAYPANPDNEYGWEKLYSERVALAYARKYPIEVRIARFENCYGPEGTFYGGREKAPAALCRKVAMAKDKDSIDIWGNGEQMRSFVYVNDLVEAIYILMHSNEKEPTNIGTEEKVSINELADMIAGVGGKLLELKHIEGHVGVLDRNFSHDKMRNLGWKPEYTLLGGLQETYRWILNHIKEAK